MSPDLRFELLAITSIVSFLVMGGLLGLWAATSRWHWFLRAMVVVCLLALVQWRPLYELYLTLLTQVAVIAVGVAIYRREFWRWRFSVGGLLQVMVVVSVLVVSLNRMPEEFELSVELKAAGLGLIGGLLTLLGAWVVVTDRRWKWRLLASVTGVIVLGVGWYFTDLLLAMFIDLHAVSMFLVGGTPGTDYLAEQLTAWSCAFLLVVLTVFVTAIARRKPNLAVTMGLLLSLFPSYVVYRLSTPLPVPPTRAPSASFTQLLALENDPLFAPIGRLEAQDDVDMEAMKTAVATAAVAFERIHDALQEELDPGLHVLDMEMERLQAYREIASLLWRRAETARLEGDPEEAARALKDLWRFSRSLDRPAAFVHALTQIAIEGLPANETYSSIDLLSRAGCLELAQQIAELNLNRTSMEAFYQCNRIQEENAYGWHGHWCFMLQEWAGIPGSPKVTFEWLRQRQMSLAALLATELALRAYHDDHVVYPETLESLVPNYLPYVPIDACSPEGEPIVYRKTEEGYTLYSRGYDGDDDLGQAPTARIGEDWAWGGVIDWTTNGDLSLKEYFKEE